MRQKRLRNRPPPSGTDVHVLVQIEPLDPKYSPFDELCRLLSRRLAGFQKSPDISDRQMSKWIFKVHSEKQSQNNTSYTISEISQNKYYTIPEISQNKYSYNFSEYHF